VLLLEQHASAELLPSTTTRPATCASAAVAAAFLTTFVATALAGTALAAALAAVLAAISIPATACVSATTLTTGDATTAVLLDCLPQPLLVRVRLWR